MRCVAFQANHFRVGEALIDLFDPDTCVQASIGAVDLWRTRYSMKVVSELVGSTYREALATRL